MKFTSLLTAALATSSTSASFLFKEAQGANGLSKAVVEGRHSSMASEAEILRPEHALEKRKGGGGKGGGGGSSGGKTSGGSSGSSGSSSRTGGTSTTGGSTKSGSGPARSFGGGSYYGGGAAVPYKAGSKTPKGLLAGALLLPATALLLMPGIWLWSVYPYHLSPYRFYNASATRNSSTTSSKFRRQNSETGANVTLPVTCLCQDFAVCSCEDNDNDAYIKSLVGDGDYSKLNKSLVNVVDANGTTTLVINGTLPNGTTAPGGTDDAAAGLRVAGWAGYVVVLGAVGATVGLL